MTFKEWFDYNWANYHGSPDQQRISEIFSRESWDYQQNHINDRDRRLETVYLLNDLVADGYSFTLDYDPKDDGWMFGVFSENQQISVGLDKHSMDKAIKKAISQI